MRRERKSRTWGEGGSWTRKERGMGRRDGEEKRERREEGRRKGKEGKKGGEERDIPKNEFLVSKSVSLKFTNK
jgi:hypothetical protein